MNLTSSPPNVPPHSLLSLSGVRLSGHTSHDLGRHHRLSVRPTHNPQHLPRALDCLAPLLRPLASSHGGFPLLQGYHHLPRTPTQGTKVLVCMVVFCGTSALHKIKSLLKNFVI